MSLRLLPVLIAVGVLTLIVRVDHIRQALWPGGPAAAYAREAASEPPPHAPAADGAAPAESGGPAPEAWSLEAAHPPAAEVPPPDLRDPYEFTDEEIDLLQQLSARRQEIEAQGRDVEQRVALLAAAEQRVDEKIAALEVLRARIEELVVQQNEQEESQIRSLVKIYENMKPKDAARIFEELDMIVLLEVVDRMKERKVAPVLAEMSPDRAKEITLELAQRRDLPLAKE